ncbi:MAG: hypothetical protein KGL39_13270 [Patescibacteria group bacterium]|nr:hypothetical protein [Patescibacteria group bacterium]
MIPILAEISNDWILGCTIASTFCGVCGVAIALVALNKKTPIQVSPQPLAVEVVEELHKQFADKQDFEKFVARTDSDINRVREILRVEIPQMERRITQAGDERIRRVHRRLDPVVIGLSGVCVKLGVKMPRTVEEE